MIEVTASLPKGSVFIACETIECLVTFANNTDLQTLRSQSSRDVQETLAWASAQIICTCSVNEGKVALPRSSYAVNAPVVTYSQDTSFAPTKGEQGYVVVSTKPKILFCDIRLSPGESKCVLYRETLPMEAPPSFRGQAVKYSYKITIGTQRVHSPIKLLKLPIRVLVLQGLSDNAMLSESEEVSPSNPFLEPKKQISALDVALDFMQTLTARKTTNSYSITNDRGKVVRFCLFKNAYKLGEDIIGTFDFSEATVPCVEFLVTLQSEEVISSEYQAKASQNNALVSHSKYHEVCLHLRHTHMILPIPLFVTPTFTTDIVSFQWKLHFEFVTSVNPVPQPILPHNEGENVMAQAPPSLEVETMVWDMPIRIYPTNPAYVAFNLPFKTREAIRF